MSKCLEILIEGRVQGVGFRNYALSKAIRFDIKGYTRNMPEGHLEIICCGEKNDLEKFLSEIKKGPSFAFISNIKINDYAEMTDFTNFEIIY